MMAKRLDTTITNFLQEMAAYVIEQLTSDGITVQRYDSVTSNSIYLKLDYGVCNSIRISDHKGIRQYRYRYNLHSDRTGYRKHDNSGVVRHYYGFDAVDEMLSQIIEDRNVKVLMYGVSKYQEFMETNELVNSGRKGFWENSYLVNI